MSGCETQHTNVENKYCPTCGVKLEHDEAVVKKLNEEFKKFNDKYNDLCSTTGAHFYEFTKFMSKIGIKLTFDVYYHEVDHTFYTMKHYFEQTEDLTSYCLYTVSTSDYIKDCRLNRQSFEQIKEYYLERKPAIESKEKFKTAVKNVFGNNNSSNVLVGRLEDVISTIERHNKEFNNEITVEKLQQFLSKVLIK